MERTDISTRDLIDLASVYGIRTDITEDSRIICYPFGYKDESPKPIDCLKSYFLEANNHSGHVIGWLNGNRKKVFGQYFIDDNKDWLYWDEASAFKGKERDFYGCEDYIDYLLKEYRGQIKANTRKS